ncbi:hypothetical protein NL676_020951 [Syzygium grande]|nr:hypothetical protein NL676_020951 [Syzygium grande]
MHPLPSSISLFCIVTVVDRDNKVGQRAQVVIEAQVDCESQISGSIALDPRKLPGDLTVAMNWRSLGLRLESDAPMARPRTNPFEDELSSSMK